MGNRNFMYARDGHGSGIDRRTSEREVTEVGMHQMVKIGGNENQ